MRKCKSNRQEELPAAIRKQSAEWWPKGAFARLQWNMTQTTGSYCIRQSAFPYHIAAAHCLCVQPQSSPQETFFSSSELKPALLPRFIISFIRRCPGIHGFLGRTHQAQQSHALDATFAVFLTEPLPLSSTTVYGRVTSHVCIPHGSIHLKPG